MGIDHELYGQLPFYWYEHGPFSEVIASEFDNLKKYCYSYSSRTFLIEDKYFDNMFYKNLVFNQYPEIEDIITKITDDKNNFFNKFDEEIYKDYAPYSFMHPFKHILFNTAQNNVALYENFDIENYLNTFLSCISSWPHDGTLDEFFVLFSRLSSRLELLNDENQIRYNWYFLRIPIIDSWFTFARGIRIDSHDNYYDNHLESWKKEFNDKLVCLKNTINTVEDKTNDLLTYENFDSSSFERKIYYPLLI